MEMISMDDLNLAWSGQPLPVVLERWTHTVDDRKRLYGLFFLGASTPSARSPGGPCEGTGCGQKARASLPLMLKSSYTPLSEPDLGRAARAGAGEKGREPPNPNLG